MVLQFNRQRRWAIGIATAVSAYIVLADLVLRPIHEGGGGPPLLAYLDGTSAVLQFPGFLVVQRLGLRDGHHTSFGVWVLILLATFVLYAVATRLAMGAFQLGRPPAGAAPAGCAEPTAELSAVAAGMLTEAPQPQPPQPSVPSESLQPTSRRRFLINTARLAVGGGAATAAYSFLVEPHWFTISRHRVPLRDLPPELDGLLAVQLSDIHHGPSLTLEYVRQVVRAANALKPDLILLTGDYVYSSPQYIEPVMRELAELRGTVGVVGVLGNHDWWEDPTRTRRAFAAHAIPLIDNDRVFFTPDRRLVRRSGEGLCIAGVGDYMEDVIRPDAALSQVPAAMPRLLLSHNPDVAEDPDFLRGQHRVDLMISGHTHGGQIWLPGLGTPIVPSRYGQKYRSGFVDGPACKVFVSKGLGTTLLPVRFCVPPEIAAFELRCG